MQKHLYPLVLGIALSLVLTGCGGDQNSSSGVSSSSGGGSSSSNDLGTTPSGRYADGVYRGVYLDRDGLEVAVEFALKDSKVEEMDYRVLTYAGVDYLKAGANLPTAEVADQYLQLIEELVGKELPEGLEALYAPGEVAKDVDGFTSATLYSGKVISAIQDGLNRGVYALPEEGSSSSSSSSSSAPESTSSGPSSAPESSSSGGSSSSEESSSR